MGRLLLQGELFFAGRHLLPDEFQILGDFGVIGIAMKCTGEPAISGGQIAGSAVAGGVHGSEQSLSACTLPLSRHGEIFAREGTILWDSVAVEIFFAAGGKTVAGYAWRGSGNWRWSRDGWGGLSGWRRSAVRCGCRRVWLWSG